MPLSRPGPSPAAARHASVATRLHLTLAEYLLQSSRIVSNIIADPTRNDYTRADTMDRDNHVPTWLYRPLPANATADAALNARIDELSQELPQSLTQLHNALNTVRMLCEYDVAANRASEHVWHALERCYAEDLPSVRIALL